MNVLDYIKENEELIEYNPDGNFDRVISFGLCMVYNLEMFNVNVKDSTKENKQIQSKTLTNNMNNISGSKLKYDSPLLDRHAYIRNILKEK